jgi:hypothetical protein
MSADLAFQIALRARLTGTPAVTDLVPAASILDRHQRPVPMPSIVLGETQLVDEGTSLKRRHLRLYHILHVWRREPSLEGVKGISAVVRAAVHAGRLDLGSGLHCADLRVSSIRHLRDPDGETSHGS